MIVPGPRVPNLHEIVDVYPCTLAVVFINILMYFLVFASPQVESVESPAAPKVREFSSAFIENAGRFYLEWKNESQYGRQTMELQSIGSQGVRDNNFLFAIEKWESAVDPVGYMEWKSELQSTIDSLKSEPISIFGLSQIATQPLTWLTYQFSHLSSGHLLSNVLLMIFFAAVVESMVGGFLMLTIYLMGGLMGGYFFIVMDQAGFIPMIGASASLTGLAGFIAVGSLKKNIPYLYFIAPIRGWFGYIYMSPLWVISLFLIEDLTQILSAPLGWGTGVAHSAHLGGAFAGIVMGLAHRLGHRPSSFLSGGKSSS